MPVSIRNIVGDWQSWTSARRTRDAHLKKRQRDTPPLILDLDCMPPKASVAVLKLCMLIVFRKAAGYGIPHFLSTAEHELKLQAGVGRVGARNRGKSMWLCFDQHRLVRIYEAHRVVGPCA